MKLKSLALIAIASLSAVSCSTPKDIVYFQDVHPGSELYVTTSNNIIIQPKDQLQIIVSTSDQRLTDQFNIQTGSNSSLLNSSNNGTGGIGYIVDSYGNIDFPVIGTIHVQGMTREEVAAYIRTQLTQRDLVKDPVVIVQFMNLSVAVLGEVASPGRIPIRKDKLTILDAIADAGDLTIDGRRDNVTIIRNDGNKEQVYQVDLTNAASIYTSPVYYLQQDDVIYVEPNKKAQRGATANGNTLQTYGFWMSLATFLMSIGVLVFK